ncbi:MAG: DUF2087 domain-containing protein [Clostridiales bacterium]|nr:DUF2087 domain-containing protein [Clostridiales bacterium]
MESESIKGYLDANGRITKMPSKKKKKLYVLSYLADRIPADREFTEKEFNELLNNLHTFGDAATLRREMYDYFLVNRRQNGILYTLNKDRPSAEELVEKYC